MARPPLPCKRETLHAEKPGRGASIDVDGSLGFAVDKLAGVFITPEKVPDGAVKHDPPPYMSATSRATFSTSLRSCVTITEVEVEPSDMPRMRSAMESERMGSRPAVGSSYRMISGSSTRRARTDALLHAAGELRRGACVRCPPGRRCEAPFRRSPRRGRSGTPLRLRPKATLSKTSMESKRPPFWNT